MPPTFTRRPLKITLFTVMLARYLSGRSTLSSRVVPGNVLPSLRSEGFMRLGARLPARWKITHVGQRRRTLHPVESLYVTRIGCLRRGGRARERVQRGSAVNGASVPAGRRRRSRRGRGCCRRLWTAGCPPGAPKTKATRTQLGYKARSRRNHKTASVGGKQTEKLILHNLICTAHF